MGRTQGYGRVIFNASTLSCVQRLARREEHVRNYYALDVVRYNLSQATPYAIAWTLQNPRHGFLSGHPAGFTCDLQIHGYAACVQQTKCTSEESRVKGTIVDSTFS